MSPPKSPPRPPTRRERLLLSILALSVGAVSICGIVYQLIVGTVSTYLLGNSTFQYSMTIGLFMSAYGLGAFLSTRIRARLVDIFVLTEILVGVIGGLSAFVLFYLYAFGALFELGRVALILGLGTLVGLEMPLLIRISEELRRDLRMTVGQMMGVDYLGALLGGVAFPLVLLPVWGLMGSSLLIGLFNVVVALVMVRVFWPMLRRGRAMVALSLIALLVLGGALIYARPLERVVERELYEDPLVYVEQTPYQKIVMTRRGDDLRLYLDGSLQFSSRDEYRYHEALIHPAASRLRTLRRVMVLGGGDGLALRELGHYPDIEQITLVDLDPAMTRLGRSHELLHQLNEEAFEHLPVEVLNLDAFNFVRDFDPQRTAPYDLIVVDLPDPHHESLAKLYSLTFYVSLHELLSPGGVMVAQLGSPFFANRSYWSAVQTLERAGWSVHPYHANVPSFGEWGFALATDGTPAPAPLKEHRGRFYDTAHDAELFHFPPDLTAQHPVEVNTLMRPVIIDYFQDDWRSWN
ncbi:polyamine aminopropyltransferase [Lujinxingia litoralis]|uniref:Polyamine aminopropyltransferase n=1 Tax=Lujinxingia litoralis TaxID=2211119 RepID=A0A328C815_9DELT|nr:polyamine aminopropyltransferase [Lujinxingia litoralis]RAL21798.1 polyamine aminopropyltransferase [Lujinxingia litoralis]